MDFKNQRQCGRGFLIHGRHARREQFAAFVHASPQGYYGRVTILLDRSAGQLSLPSSCLVGKTEEGTGSVYVVRDHHVHLAPVKISADNGIRFAVREGLSPKDQVILHPSSTLAELHRMGVRLALDDTATILEGAAPAAAMALVVHGLFELLDRVTIPRGLRRHSSA